MATHASGDLRGALRPSRPAVPRAAYNVGARCRTTALSIAALLVLFVVLVLI
ncbi:MULTISPECIES: hypothetical protein [unclassified Gordonia (in: high G+C Gram-positive bacteria)]|uniref:hypothetical protein n=1 Tax=unclassified Gordonia (in: high G+C Gram-positive bacteria) TaxID=2657482 RepID=UPI001F0FE231|nr:hypothetical protein [Gordonia sp. ABSL49_1]MCH5642876.1 hypothetical protein [Gordonia sp. ABSL49_1]